MTSISSTLYSTMKNTAFTSFLLLLPCCLFFVSGCDSAQPLNKEHGKPVIVQEVPLRANVSPDPPESTSNESEATPDVTPTNATSLPPPTTPSPPEQSEFPDTAATPETQPIRPSTPPGPGIESGDITTSDDDKIAELFANRKSDVQVCGAGIVSRLLPDDNEGDRHQRFILKLKSGQTLLMAHNIDIAPRLDGLAVGDRVEFFGEYYYNEKGGGIHWTHHDPVKRRKKHVDGWLKWNGTRFD